MVHRSVVVQLWSGPVTVRRLRFQPAGQAAWVDQMTDAAVKRNLRRLGVDPIPATAAERETRLATWPTQADLDSLAAHWTPANGGVRPVVRVLERTPSLRPVGVGAAGGPAGTAPRSPRRGLGSRYGSGV